MSIVLDILVVIFVLLGALAGWKKGLIKSAVNLIGLIAVVIISYALKGSIANFLIDKMPFLNFAGTFEGLTSVNILIYNLIAFVVIFIVLYCILSVVLAVTGFIDTILKFTVIWILPSKIGGAIIGFLEAWVYVFLVLFILAQLSITASFVLDSTVGKFMLNHTPIVGTTLNKTTSAAKEIYDAVKNVKDDENKNVQDLNLTILQIEINQGLITKEKATELIETGKLELGNVMFGKGDNSWLNI